MTWNVNAGEWRSSVRQHRRRIGLWIGIVALELYLLVAYFVLTPAIPTGELRYLVYPFLWINAGIWAARTVTPTPANRRHRAVGVGIAALYLLLLLYLPGAIGSGTAGVATDFRVAMAAPGWGPVVALTSPLLRLYLVPFEVVGYVALAYLVYANALRTSRSTLSGALGLVTCVGCTVPILVPLVGALGGPATGLATTAYAWSYDLGTATFLVAIWLLVRGATGDDVDSHA